jgi:hypothetical protein
VVWETAIEDRGLNDASKRWLLSVRGQKSYIRATLIRLSGLKQWSK